jgi:ankyrin repeat protein
MASSFSRTLPPRPDLDQQKKLAKELIKAYRDRDPNAVARIRAELPDKPDVSLADAQFVLAREYGFASWRELKEHIEQRVRAAQPPVDRFKRAISRSDAATARTLLQQHADVRAAINEPIFGFDSPALVAASGKNLELVDVLLEFGADPNRKSSWWAGGFHPLYGANDAVAQRLIAAGATIDACAAAHLDRADLLSSLIAADPARVSERGGDGKMPLHLARSRRVVDILLASGADIDGRDIDHRSTAAEWMIGDDPDEARMDVARYLVERGASADIFLVAALGMADRARTILQADPSVLQLRTGQGSYGEKHPSSYHIYFWTIGQNMSPLQTAAKFDQRETLRVMQEFATPTQRLLLACHVGDRDEATRLVTGNPGLVPSLAGADRRALANEAWAANAPAVELMLDLGFDPASPSGSGSAEGNALHCASWEGSAECVAAILRHPAGRALVNVRETTYNGTPLNWCAHGSINCRRPGGSYGEVARLLIAAGTTLDAAMADWDASDEVLEVLDSAMR